MRARTAKGALNEARRELDYQRCRQAEMERQRKSLYELLKQWGAEIEFAPTLGRANSLREWAYGACALALAIGAIGCDEERDIDKTLEDAYLRAAKRIAAQRAEDRAS